MKEQNGNVYTFPFGIAASPAVQSWPEITQQIIRLSEKSMLVGAKITSGEVTDEDVASVSATVMEVMQAIDKELKK